MRWKSGVVIAAFAGGSIGFSGFAEAAWPPKWFGKTSVSVDIGGAASAEAIGPAQHHSFTGSSNQIGQYVHANVSPQQPAKCGVDVIAIGFCDIIASAVAYAYPPSTTDGTGLFEARVLVQSGAENTAQAAGGFGPQECPIVYPKAAGWCQSAVTLEFQILRPVRMTVQPWTGTTSDAYEGSGARSVLAKARLSGASLATVQDEIGLPPIPASYLEFPSRTLTIRAEPGSYTLESLTSATTSAHASFNSNQVMRVTSSTSVGVFISPILCPESDSTPTDILWPANYTGGSVSFQVHWQAYDISSISCQWYRNGMPLSDMTIPGGTTITGSTSAYLQIDNATPSYAGVYTCILTCSDGCDPVTILGGTFRTEGAACGTEPEVSTLSPASTSSCVGGELSMSVDATNTESIQWLRNGGVLSDGPTIDGAIISGSNTGTLTITGAKETDSGSYGILATGPCSSRFFNSLFAATVAGSCCPADLNGDNAVDDSDFVLFVNAYNILDCADPAMPAGCASDFNSDTIVDDSDFVIFVPAYDQLLCN